MLFLNKLENMMYNLIYYQELMHRIKIAFIVFEKFLQFMLKYAKLHNQNN